jgi:hypothetical protein
VNFLLAILATVFTVSVAFASPAHADGAAPVTAVIDIDNRSVSIGVDDLSSCVNAISNRINSLKMLYQDNLTATSVVAECFGHDGKLLASGRCGVKMVGQLTRLCVPAMN